MARNVDLLERRIRPLYEAIDSRNYKQALKLANGVIQKHPESLLVKTLKALTLERMGKIEEALALCTEVKNAGTADEHVLNTVCVVYKNLGRFDEATKCFEFAASKHAKNTELQVALFNAYAREHKYTKQQQVAMRLYKMIGEDKYLMWAVCSIHLQAKGTKDASMRRQLFQIAEALMKKRIQSPTPFDYESLLIHLSILSELGKHGEALEAVEGPLGNLVALEADKLRIKGEMLMLQRDYKRAYETYMELLEANSDDWLAWLHYLDAVLSPSEEQERTMMTKTSNGSGKGDEGDAGATVDAGVVAVLQNDDAAKAASGLYPEVECSVPDGERGPKNAEEHASFWRRWLVAKEFVHKLQEKESQDLRRGSFLAELDLIRRYLDHAVERREDFLGDGQSGSLQSEILSYFKKFGHLGSFATDVRLYMSYLTKAGKCEWLLRSLHTVCDKSIETEESAVRAFKRRMSVLQVEEQVGLVFEESDAEIIKRGVAMAKLFRETLHLSDEVEMKEKGHNEDLLCMCVNHLMLLYTRTHNLGYALEALLLLEQGLSYRRYNRQYSLILVNLYSLFGAAQLALPCYAMLEIKHIMHDTMSHHLLPGLLHCARWKEAQQLFDSMGRLYRDHHKESAELLLQVFKHNTYSKVEEFVEFRRRLESSHQRLSMRIEVALIQLKTQAEAPAMAQAAIASICDVDLGRAPLEWVSDADLQQLSCNEDLRARPWWHPAPEECMLERGGREGSKSHWHVPESEEQRVAREARWRLAFNRRCLVPRMVWLAISGNSAVARGDTTAARVTGTAERVQMTDSSSSLSSSSSSLENAEELRHHVSTYASTLGLVQKALSSCFQNFVDSADASGKGVNDLPTSADELLFLAVFLAASDMLLIEEPCGDVSSLHGRHDREVAASSVGKHLKAATLLLDRVISEVVRELFDDVNLSWPQKDCGVIKEEMNGEGRWKKTVIRPGLAIQRLTGLVCETLAWLSLCAQAWMRSFPATKRKKKGASSGPLEGSSAAVLVEVRAMVQSAMSETTSSLNKLELVLRSHLDWREEEEVHALLSSVKSASGVCMQDGEEGCRPGEMLKVIEQECDPAARAAPRKEVKDSKVGEEAGMEEARTVMKFVDPEPAAVLRRLVKGQREVLGHVHNQLLVTLKVLRKFRL